MNRRPFARIVGRVADACRDACPGAFPGAVAGLLAGATVGATLILALTASPARAQDADGNVFHDAESLPWGEPSNGTRFLPLYGNYSVGGEVFAFRLEVQPGFEIRPHTHPVTEHMTVLSGRFFVGMGETMDKSAGIAYGPGSYIAIAAGLPAYMWAEEVTVIQVHGVGPFSTQFVEPPSEG